MQALEPKRRVLFLDTSALPGAGECQAGDQLSNPAEADTIMRIVDSLQGAGIRTGSIGVISPYRSQVSPFSALQARHCILSATQGIAFTPTCRLRGCQRGPGHADLEIGKQSGWRVMPEG